jgi:hypothetical protein
MTLADFLVWLVAGGSIVAISWLFERFGWFQSVSSNARENIMFVFCALLSCGAYAVQTFVPADVLLALAPWFGIIAGTFAMVFVSKSFHKVDKKIKA